MDDLSGLSWASPPASSQPALQHQQQQQQLRNGHSSNGTSAAFVGMRDGILQPTPVFTPKVKPPVPPISSKPAHLQMSRNAGPTLNNSNNNSLSSLSNLSNNRATSSTQPGRSPSNDVFGSLIPDFGKDKGAANLESMSLDERRLHFQQQQQQQQPCVANTANNSTASSTINRRDDFSMLSNSLLSSSPSPSPLPMRSATTSSTTPLSALNSGGIQASVPQARLSPAFPGVMSSTSRGQSPASLQTPLQPSRSGSSSPAPTRDPFENLLGNQSSRSTPPAMNHSLNALRANTPPIHQPTTAGAADPWDLDFLANSGSTTNKANEAASQQDSSTFDLGDFEKALPEKAAFAPPKPPRPNGASPAVSSPPSTASSRRREDVSSPSSVNSTGKDSLVATIVEMGFTAQQAKTALAMTPSGDDVEAAIDLLVQNKAAAEELNSQKQQRHRERTKTSDRNYPDSRERGSLPRRHVDDEDDFEPPLVDRRRRQQDSTGQSTRAQQFQQQKDRLVETASAFGFSVLSKASDLYKQSKEKMQAVMDDMGAEDERTRRLRRHQWVEEERAPGAYKDSDSEDEVFKSMRAPTVPAKPRREVVDDYYNQRNLPASTSQPRSETSSRRVQERENFEGTYVSSSRRAGGGASQRRTDLLSSSGSSHSSNQTSTTPVKKQPLPTPSKPARPPRTLVHASPQQISHSNQLKEKGNELFKLGQFGQAAEMYAQASQVLPVDHLTLIVLYNNRAAALIKTGEYRETVEICTRSIAIIQGPDGEGVNDVLPPTAGVNLKEQLSKALMRRATAYENMEKYKDAKRDWAQLREVDANNKSAIEGLRRCEKAINVEEGRSEPTPLKKASPASTGFATTTSARSSPLQDMYASVQSSAQQAKAKAAIQQSEGVSKLREAARQQEKEDEERLRLRDQVDLRMAQWKAGKEDNLRALIASLHTVLWEGAGWKAVGMHELVTASQVKVKYMRAIGRMHPDKLGPQTTVEQRMMANTIFSTLNSAWDAFKVQNNM
ncbi:hypothetical protein BGW42_003941 [Actinomortierella wolfii]|nr:hypothetical protein BGW42_003941 [Actinomortierella wolfii]